jgi:hypothetical protein
MVEKLDNARQPLPGAHAQAPEEIDARFRKTIHRMLNSPPAKQVAKKNSPAPNRRRAVTREDKG